MHKREQLSRTKRPAVFKDTIVDIFQTQPGEFAKDIETVEDVLQVYQTNVPGAVLLANYRFEGGGGGAMSAPGIKENEIDGWSFYHVKSLLDIVTGSTAKQIDS